MFFYVTSEISQSSNSSKLELPEFHNFIPTVCLYYVGNIVTHRGGR